jgi:protein-tyrosine-phosphatase
MAKPEVLFLGTGNSCRSQMAGGLLRHFADDRIESIFPRVRDEIGQRRGWIR